MHNDWDTDGFTAEEIRNKMQSREFDVPKYQRGIVWTDSQRLELVDTIKKGLPFGSLLLYKKDDGGYQIIDGLQRCTSLIKFVENPTRFFEEEDIDPDVIKKIAKEIGVAGNQTVVEEKVQDLLKTWVEIEHPTMADVEAMQFSKFGKKLSDEFPTLQGREIEIGDMIQPMMTEYKSICKKISETRVPAIVVTGDQDLLPVLFERINSKGTTLTKYQIYAATWIDEKYKIDNDDLFEIVSANRDRYDQMLDNLGSLGDYDSVDFINSRELNTFEIAYGFGKLLSHKWPHLFSPATEEIAVESIGFNLINICLGMKNQDIKVMNSALREQIGDDVCLFLLRILEAVEFVDERIGKYCKFKLNSRIKEGRPLHTEYQIVSMIASVFLCQHANISYDDDYNVTSVDFVLDKTKQGWKNKQKAEYKNNAGKIYVMDILQRKWAGTGDRKMDQIIMTPDYYCKEINIKDFEDIIDTWYKQLNGERLEIGKVASPKEPEQLMLSLLYISHFNAGQQLDGSKYDIEHLATKKLMKKQLGNFNGDLKLPISSFGNLCLLPEYENRSKGEKTLYSDSDYLKKSSLSLDQIEKDYSFTTQESLQWINDFTLTADELKESYFEFINNRFKTMKGIILEQYDSI